MTGIERLRELARRSDTLAVPLVHGTYCAGYVAATEDMREQLSAIADQIERELTCDADTIENVRLIVGGVIADMERHTLGHEGMEDSPVARWARELRDALGGEKHDPAEDVSMSAHDLLPQEDREAIAWVREHGGLAEVEKEWNVRSNLKRSLETAQAKVERQQRHIEFAQGKCHERLERIAALNKTVAEMRQRLMPEGMEWLVEAWPRFEDDAPLRIGDEGLDAYGRAHRAERVTLSEGGHVDVCDESGDVWWSNTRRDEHDDVMLDLGKRIKRPAPKVLDADGVEIELGDELYGCESGRGPFRVSGVLSDSAEVKLMSYLDGSEFMTCAATFTHRAPALASDGKPLREGETVWDVDGRGPLAVWSLPEKSDMHVSLKKDGTFYYRHPDQLTHERPVADTWERMEEDACSDDCEYFGRDMNGCKGCPASRQDIDDFYCDENEMALDLVRRCRELAGVSE